MEKCSECKCARTQHQIASRFSKQIVYKNGRLKELEQKIAEKDMLLLAANERNESLEMEAEGLKQELGSQLLEFFIFDGTTRETINWKRKREAGAWSGSSKAESEQLEKELKRALEENQKMRVENEKLTAMERKIDEQDMILRLAREETHSVNKEKESLKNEMETLTRKLEQQKQELKRSLEENQKLKLENERLTEMERKIDEKDMLLRAGKEEVKSLKIETERLKDEMNSLLTKSQEEKQSFNREKGNLMSERKSLLEKQEEQEKELRRSLEENQRVKLENEELIFALDSQSKIQKSLEENLKMKLQNDNLICEVQSQDREDKLKNLECQESQHPLNTDIISDVPGPAALANEGTENFHHGIELQNEKLNVMMELHKPAVEQLIQKLKMVQEKLKGKFKDLQDEIEFLNDNNNVLTHKERMSNDELQAARKQALNVLCDFLDARMPIRIKTMGEIDQQPFQEFCSPRFPHGEWREESARLCSVWDKRIGDPTWHPFRIEDINGEAKRIIDEDDAELKELRNEYGEAVYKSVINALLELEEYNPSARYPVRVFWVPKEGRAATLKEIISYIGSRLARRKRKRSRRA